MINNEKGFTLTETMVVVVIFTAMMSLALVVFLGNIRVQRTALFQQRLVNEVSYALKVIENKIKSGEIQKEEITTVEVKKLVNSDSVTILSVKTKEINGITVLLQTRIKIDEKKNIDFILQTTAKSR